MSSFRIRGGKRLRGEIQPQGAKNEALQILCAVLLTDQPVAVHNIPDILDVNKLISLVGDLGCKVEKLEAVPSDSPPPVSTSAICKPRITVAKPAPSVVR